MRAVLLRLVADRRGGPAVEFAIIAPLLLTLLLGGVDFGRMFYVRQGLEYATEQAARYYMLNVNTGTSNVTSYLQGMMPGGMGPSVNVSYADTASCNGQANVTCTTITATYAFNFQGYVRLGALTLRATAQAVRLF
jgi:Flp pilus assembly protein TadG